MGHRNQAHHKQVCFEQGDLPPLKVPNGPSSTDDPFYLSHDLDSERTFRTQLTRKFRIFTHPF
jgi:hypothetical protein